MAQLVEHDKKFLIIGSRNAVHYKEIFRLIKKNQVWLGVDNGGTKWFRVQDDYDIQTESRKKVEGGVKYFSMGTIMWFTNMDNPKRHEKLQLYKKYSPAEYPTYDNYNAIEVARFAEIPADYSGAMGVPDTFIDRYNPDQFDIVGIPFGDLGKEIGVTKNHRGRTDIAITEDGRSRSPYSRIIIKRK